MKPEKREHDRYRVPPNTFVVLGQKISRVGKVKEISLGGLGLEYVSDRSTIVEPRQVEIFIAGNGFHLSGIPCRLIYDLPRSTMSQTDALPFITKKCGLAFDQPSEEQHSQLQYFIQTHTLGLSP